MPTIRTRPVCPAPASPVPRMGPVCTFPPGRPGMPVRLVCGRFPDPTGNVALGALALLDAVGVGDLAPGVAAWLRDEVVGDKADKATTLAGYGIADAYTKTETDGKISTAVSAEATARNIAIATAINAVKDSAPEAFDTLKEIADWIDDDQSGAAAMAAQVSSHTSQLSQLSQNKVDKVAGKGLSTNDYTTNEKTKLSGVEAGAKDNVVEAASASAFPQQGAAGKIYVAKDENKTYRWSGTQYVQIGGGGGSSVEVVPPSTDPADEGKAADAKATGDALAGKRGMSDMRVPGAPYVEGGEAVGKVYFDGVEAPYLDMALYWMTQDGSFEIWPYSTGSYRLTDFSDHEDIKSQDFTLNAANGYTATVLGHEIRGFVGTLAKVSDIPAASDATPQMDGTGAAGASNTFARADHVHPTDASRASANDVVLTPVYGGNGSPLSDWTILRGGDNVTSSVAQPVWVNDNWLAIDSVLSGEISVGVQEPGASDEDAMSLTWLASLPDSLDTVSYTATRTENPIIGYTLGSQTTKPLQPQGDYAPATALRYDLPANATTITSASSEIVEGETVTYGEATLADRTANIVAITAAIAELRLTFPAAVSGKVRDFGLRVEVGDGTAALTAPALVPPAGVTLENSDGAIPALADGAADAKGVTLLYFSETAPGVFLVKGEQVKEA